jgi:ribosomal protein L29
MKKDEKKELAQKSVAQLMTMVNELSQKLADLRLQFKAGKQPKVSIKATADSLARVKTHLTIKAQEE